MKSFFVYELLALLGGAALACLVEINGAVAASTSATFSSLMNHLAGSIFGLVLLGATLLVSRSRRSQLPEKIANLHQKLRETGWAYLAGIGGAMVVVCITFATNSPLGDVGALATLFLGQILFGLLVDQMGWFAIKVRAASKLDLLQIALILSGSSILIFYARPR